MVNVIYKKTKKEVILKSSGKKFKTKIEIHENSTKDKIKLARLWMCESWPDVFNVKKPIPLKVGIHRDIYNEYRKYKDTLGFSRLNLKLALQYWVRSKRYKESILKQTYRCDLSGVKVEKISEDQKKFKY